MPSSPVNAPCSSSLPSPSLSGTATVDGSATSSTTAGPSPSVLPNASLPTSQASHSSPAITRVASRSTFRWTSTDIQQHIPTSTPTRTGTRPPPVRHSNHPPRYEQQLPLVSVSVLCEKNVVPPATSESTTRTPLPLPPHRVSRASTSSSSSSSSSWQLDEKSGALPPYRYHDDSTIDVTESGDPSWRATGPITCTPSSDSPFSSIAIRSTPSCPSSRSHSRPSSMTTTHPPHPHSLIEHQRHYRHRVKSRSCVKITIPPAVKPWLPMCTWFATTLGLIIAVAFWRTEVFTGLDDLSTYMKREGYYGQAILFGLILLTTFPPLPLYSTLMMLAGYTFGPGTAFFISYFASLLGALVVFLIFRHFVPSRIAQGLLPPSLKRVVRAIEQRPSIFLLIRVAPYPYNVLNAVLGSSSTMGVGRYLGTTAISLLKVIVHTSLGSEIRSFKDLHSGGATNQNTSTSHVGGAGDGGKKGEIGWGEIWTGIGIVLCVGLFIYLSFVARRAVDEECEHEGYEVLPTTVIPTSPSSSPPSHHSPSFARAHAPPQMRTLDGQLRQASFNPFQALTNTGTDSVEEEGVPESAQEVEVSALPSPSLTHTTYAPPPPLPA